MFFFVAWPFLWSLPFHRWAKARAIWLIILFFGYLGLDGLTE